MLQFSQFRKILLFSNKENDHHGMTSYHIIDLFFYTFNTFKNNFVDVDGIRGILECQVDTGEVSY